MHGEASETPTTPAPEAALRDLEIRLLLAAINDAYGYDLRGYAPASLRRRVLGVLGRTGLPHLGELQHKVLSEPQFFAEIFDDLLVRVSDVFRDPGFFRCLRDRVIPLLRTYPLLKIWHCGCAQGEEAYSTAVLLSEEGLLDRSQLYATDVSPRALSQAKEGVYPGDRLATFEENHREAGGRSAFASHVTTAYDQIAFKESLRHRILFFQHNLVSDSAFAEMNLVFCRNVLIYFDRELRSRVLEKLAASLCPGGFLCLGANERLGANDLSRRFSPFDEPHRIYRFEG